MTFTRTGSPVVAEKYIKAIQDELNEAALEIKTNFEQSAKTWQAPPVFIIRKTGEYEREIATSDQNYARLDKGTSVRYATMTPDFLAKSQANSLAARAGAGGVLVINRDNPRPGIAPRNFQKKVKELWDAKFAAGMRNAIDAAGV